METQLGRMSWKTCQLIRCTSLGFKMENNLMVRKGEQKFKK